jgi:hypothetical protein
MNKQAVVNYFKYFTGVDIPPSHISDKLCKDLNGVEDRLINAYADDENSIDLIHTYLYDHYQHLVEDGVFWVDHEQLKKERKEKIKDLCDTL